jgi:hypothetical protein
MAKNPAAKKPAKKNVKKSGAKTAPSGAKTAPSEKKQAKALTKPAKKSAQKADKKPPAKKSAGASTEDLFMKYVESEVQAMLEDAGVKLSKEDTEEVVLVITESLEMPVAMLVGSMMDTLVGSDDADFDDEELDDDEIDDDDEGDDDEA